MNYYDEIKEQIINNVIVKKVKDYSKNKNDLNTYYSIGRIISEAGKHYGEGIIKEYSKKLTEEFGKGYSKRNLWLMLKFYEASEKMQTMSAQLTWSHYCELLSLESLDKINYYIIITEEQNLSVRQLRDKIKSKEYERISKTSKKKLKRKEFVKVEDLIKNPIIIKNRANIETVSEKTLQRLILEDIPSFLKELGKGFTFIENEYKIKIGDRYNFIDLLLYNIKFRCYVVIELKVVELNSNHTGQIQKYMNYIDKNIKTIEESKTVGIIICKKSNRYVIEYCSDKRIIAKEYKLI